MNSLVLCSNGGAHARGGAAAAAEGHPAWLLHKPPTTDALPQAPLQTPACKRRPATCSQAHEDARRCTCMHRPLGAAASPAHAAHPRQEGLPCPLPNCTTVATRLYVLWAARQRVTRLQAVCRWCSARPARLRRRRASSAAARPPGCRPGRVWPSGPPRCAARTGSQVG